MKRALATVLLVAAGQAAAAPDFEDGVRAYDAGDYDRAREIWLPLAQAGQAAAQNNLAVLYDHGLGVEEDDAAAFGWYRRAAEQGNAQAQYSLALMYNHGHGVAEDDRAAVKWYRLAAEQGDVNAMYHLALVYDFGEGVREDDAQAAAWYRRAAELGDARSQYNLGLLYDFGHGVEEDDRQAVRWYRMAAEQGDPKAQYTLAACYFNGEGVGRDPIEAYAWMTLAASQRHVRAVQARAQVWHAMTDEQRRAGHRLQRKLALQVALRKRIEMPGNIDLYRPLSGDLIRALQSSLAERGYDPGPVDGVFGTRSIDALRRFQRDAGLTETGQPSAEMLRFIQLR